MSIIDMLAQTNSALDWLASGSTPVYAQETAPPTAPTPIYWRTAVAENFVPGRSPYKWAQAALLAGVPDRMPIPARPLSYQAHARRTDPPTSHEAARSVHSMNETHTRILRLLDMFHDVPHASAHAQPGGLTDEQLLFWWRDQFTDLISPSGLRSRRSELVRMGRVVDSGEKGRTAAGRSTIIWKLADG